MPTDKDRSGDVDVRIRGLGKNDPDLLAEDVCVKGHKLCVDTTPGEGNPAASTLGRTRTSVPRALFDSRFVRNDQSLFWTDAITGGGSLVHTADESSLALSVGTASGDQIIQQTKQYFPYQPAQSQFVMSVFEMATAQNNLRQSIGMFDADNGVFLRQNNLDAPEFVRLSSVTGSPVEEVIPQASWNIDPLDGTGDSGETLDMTKLQMLVIDFLWPGRIRLGFQLGGTIVYAHAFQALNTLAVPPFGRPSLPVRLEITNTGVTAGASEFKHYVHSVQTEGSDFPLGVIRSVDTGISSITITGVRTPVLSVRAKATDPHVNIEPVAMSLLSTNGNEFLWELLVGTELTGASWQSADPEALTEFDIAATAVVGGQAVTGGYTSSQAGAERSSLRNALLTGFRLDGTREAITIALTKVGTGNPKSFAAMTYKEL